MKRAIITGATGTIGTALVWELIYRGVEVLVLCREGSERNLRIPDHPLVEKKCCALEELASLQNDTGKQYDVFYHLAWSGTTGQARNDMYLQNRNIQYALDAVGAASRFGCSMFIGAGSQAEYGRVEGVLKPDTPTFPEMGYGYGKLCAGLMTRDYAHQLGLQHIWCRILSIYGPNDGMQSLVMSVMNALYRGEVPKCTKGEQQWDYLYSKDAAKAFFLMGKKGVDGRTYVLGSGKVRPLSQYIQEICETVKPGSTADFGAVAYSPKQVMYLCADTSILREDTGFIPDYSFAEGIRETTQWFKEKDTK